MKKILTLLLLISINFQVNAERYYWVGGSGKWSELAHWSPESGNTSLLHGVIPTYNDTVFFDQNSFSATGQTVTIDVENAICMKMDWTNAKYSPTIKNAASNNLSIYGTLVLCENMNWDFSGKIYFQSSTQLQNIITHSHNLKSSLYFNALEGNWDIDNLITTGDINLNGLDSKLEIEGKLSTDNKINISTGTITCEEDTITASEIIASSSIEKKLFFDNSTIILSYRWLLGSEKITLHNSNTNFYLTGTKAKFYGGDSQNYNKIQFDAETDLSTYLANNCNVDSLVCKAGLTISGNNNIFQFANISSNATLKGNNTYGKLWLSPNKTYTLESEKTQTIITELIANGECSGFSHLRSSATAPAIIHKESGNITTSHLLIENVEATGGASFTANNSDGLKSTLGWTINKNPRTLYWVGGNGDWDNPDNWSLTSGGTGGECIPFPVDNVIFDDNSFPAGNETVMVNTFKAYCNNMQWRTTTGTPTFTTFNKKMRIFASLQLSEFMNFNYQCEFHFLSEKTGNTIDMAGKQFSDTVYFNGEGGEWTLLDSMDCAYNNLYLTKGTLNTNNNKINCYDFTSNNSNNRGLILGNSEITIYNNWITDNSVNFSFDAGTSLIQFKAVSAKIQAGNELNYYNLLFTQINGQGTIESASCTYNKAYFLGNGNFIGTNYIDTLELSAGKVYKLDTDKPQHINTLLGKGSCSGYILLSSDLVGTQANIIKPGGSLAMEYLILQDINATEVNGGLIATKSIDMGNNTACTITSPPSENLYWVGGTGNWAESANWAYTSGGAGGACVPSPADNVFFDKNSFTDTNQQVSINIKEAFCKSMNWTGALFQPEIDNEGVSKLSIYGSLTLIKDMSWNYNGDVIFESNNQNNTITSAGNVFYKNLYFQGQNGIWNLSDSLTVTQSLNLVAGTLQTNSHTLRASSLQSLSGFPSALKPQNSNIILESAFNVNGNFALGEGDFEVFITRTQAHIALNCNDSLIFNNVYFSYPASDNILLDGSTKARFKNVYFESVGEISGLGTKTADTVIFKGSGKLANKCKIIKTIFQNYGKVWDSTQVDTVIMLMRGDITGKNNIKYLSAKDEILITGDNIFGTCHMIGDGDVYGQNIFDTLIFTPDKRYTFQGGRTQKINKEFTIRGNNCRHIYFISSNNEKATIEKTEGSVMGDYIEMQNIIGTGGATFYAGNFDHSDNIGNSCEGWKFEDQPGYIYGLQSDTILVVGEKALISGEYMNGDSFTKYLWSNGSNSQNLEVSKAGKYTLTANYGLVNGFVCEYSDDIIVHFAKLTPPYCSQDANGKIEILTSNNNNYEFLWNNGETLNYIENLAQDSFSVEVTEIASGRKASRTFNLPDGLVLDLNKNIQNPSCYNLNNGKVNLSTNNGVAPFTYKWLNYGNVLSNEMSDLPFGEYIIEVSDAHCSKIDTLTLTQPKALELNFETTISCDNKQGGSIIAHAKGGTPSYSFEWADFPSVSDSSLFALSGSKYYKLTLTDANTCPPIIDSIYLAQPEALTVKELSLQNETCVGDNNGQFEFSLSGGRPDYTIKLDNNNINNTLLTNIEPGDHHLAINDKNSCLEELDFTIKAAEPSSINIVKEDVTCYNSGGTIEYQIVSNRNTKSVDWTNSNNIQLSALENLKADWYYVNFTDQENCTYTDSVEIMGSDCFSEISVPNIFTPNDDGINDLFRVSAKNLMGFRATIINRWGREVYSWGDENQGWNGRLHGKGQLLSDGVYYYLIKAVGDDGKHYDLKGYFYLQQ